MNFRESKKKAAPSIAVVLALLVGVLSLYNIATASSARVYVGGHPDCFRDPNGEVGGIVAVGVSFGFIRLLVDDQGYGETGINMPDGWSGVTMESTDPYGDSLEIYGVPVCWIEDQSVTDMLESIYPSDPGMMWVGFGTTELITIPPSDTTIESILWYEIENAPYMGQPTNLSVYVGDSGENEIPLLSECRVDIDTGDVPTLNQWGMLIIALLVLATCTIAIIRRRKAAFADEH